MLLDTFHLKSGSPKASDSARHMKCFGDQQPPFTGLWFEQHGECSASSEVVGDGGTSTTHVRSPPRRANVLSTSQSNPMKMTLAEWLDSEFPSAPPIPLGSVEQREEFGHEDYCPRLCDRARRRRDDRFGALEPLYSDHGKGR